MKVEFSLDGETLTGEEGAPIAVALVAAGKVALARSPKFHRPRGPACLRGGCDGCLMRVDGEPNVMTCLAPLRAGTEVSSQNTLGSRRFDLLRVTDWFFPQGLNHHELFAGVPGAAELMPKFARRVAGLGKLPEAPLPPREAARREVDAVVVGAGPAGSAAANALVAAGRRVIVLDEALAPGGSATARDDEGRAPLAPILDAFAANARAGRVELRQRDVALALFGDDLLVVGPEKTEILHASTLVLATGAHDGVLPFEGNDLPGITSARAAAWLLARGAAVGKTALVVAPEGRSAEAESFARMARAASIDVRFEERGLVRATGTGRVRAVHLADGDRERRVEIDWLVIDAPRSPAYELLSQAGAALRHEPRGFVPVRDERGGVAPGVFAIGECAGDPIERGALESVAARIAGA